ncbi:MAG: electron transfer flavoprotein subunit beta/FixA family protein [Candidatus Omnitrophica bacterium]|nr:electron transfer flavoprotein subunit beta/FixA family protein [Candidatus Omnitrophota bacterium]
MPYHYVVLAKQVPDTKRVTGNAMKEDGTVNRAALPAIYNPEDLNALELAITLKETYGGRITVITMGPPAAAEILREAYYRGADRCILLTDRRLAASDTLATSFALSEAIRKLGHSDIVLCGRQAIDGDTAQVGPQTAEKLGIDQISYVEAVTDLSKSSFTARRNIGNGFEIVEGPLPVLLTVTASANEPRYASAKRLMKYKKARTQFEVVKAIKDRNPAATDESVKLEAKTIIDELACRGLVIEEWNVDTIGGKAERFGLAGSPTQVVNIESVVLVGREYKQVKEHEGALSELVEELKKEYIIG